MIKEIFSGLKFSFGYFSILPVKFTERDDLSNKKTLKFMILFFPLVGFVLGFLSLKIYEIIDWQVPYISLLFGAISYMILYGFLHTEAVVDIVDAIYAKMAGKDAYKVIKEPGIGALGALWGFSVVIVKIGLISYLFYRGFYYQFLTIVIVSRISILFVTSFGEFKSSFVNKLKESLDFRTFLVFIFIYLFFTVLVLGWSIVWLLPFGVVMATILYIWVKKRVGFANGDLLGFTLEVVEVVLMFVVALYEGREIICLLPS